MTANVRQKDLELVSFVVKQFINCKFYDEMNESIGVCLLLHIGTDFDLSCDEFQFKKQNKNRE